ncbi:MAG: hypothetical protein ACYTEZ_17150 [Planctomycetota bacterium]|jgi:hypothetical protein
MTEGKRPGGLTALAVINFVFGGYDCLQVFGAIAMAVILTIVAAEEENGGPEESAAAESTAEPEADEPEADEPEADDDPRKVMAREWRKYGLEPKTLFIKAGLYLALAFLLLTSGVGYLKQRKLWGRTMGNLYAVASLGTTAFEATEIPEDVGGFGILLLVFAVYPVLTLILLNTTFKEDFVR